MSRKLSDNNVARTKVAEEHMAAGMSLEDAAAEQGWAPNTLKINRQKLRGMERQASTPPPLSGSNGHTDSSEIAEAPQGAPAQQVSLTVKVALPLFVRDLYDHIKTYMLVNNIQFGDNFEDWLTWCAVEHSEEKGFSLKLHAPKPEQLGIRMVK